jgi:DNA helicase-2/ATP-dependent DNA helicase PcrA
MLQDTDLKASLRNPGSERFQEQYKKLNTDQKKAVDTFEGPLLVVAGPGTGKTEILSLRVANILRKTDVLPDKILCLTFTDSASVNMRRRLAGLIGRDAFRVSIHTFHSFGVEIIINHPEFFYGGIDFYPANDLAQIEILDGIFNELPHDNPLRKELPETGYLYLRHVQSAIGYIKKAGLTPDEFALIIDHNKKSLELINPTVEKVFSVRVSKQTIGEAERMCHNLMDYKDIPFPVSYLKQLTQVVAGSLEIAVKAAKDDNSTKPITAWKGEWIGINEDGNTVLKDAMNLEKQYALCNIYKEYQKRLRTNGYFDFDDMIIETIQSIENNKILRYELQERYEYILVDEFQDTNDAQMRLIKLIGNPVERGKKSNIMAVGDDDQAIYKFQGAEISNILDFQRVYSNTNIITITDNYRSTQDILDLARHIILKGELRLENLIPGLNKRIVAAMKELENGDITCRVFPTTSHEYYWIAQEIKWLIESGSSPSDIAVIARQHKQLEEIATYLNALNIPLDYERHRNIFDEQHVHQIIQIARFINSLCRKNEEEADNFLPEILSYPFWQLKRKTVWDISFSAYKSGKRWLEIILEHEDREVSRIAEFMLDLSIRAKYETMEQIIDRITGAYGEELAPDAEEEDMETEGPKEKAEIISPFKKFYFNREKFDKDRIQYLSFLSSLRAFIQALREYKRGVSLRIEHLVEFVDLHKKNNIAVNDLSPFVNAFDAVNLLTAHKAKGLEFNIVFVISCQEDIWAGRGRGTMLPFPRNLSITPAGENEDDHLRLFYVAITRAKLNLYLTLYKKTDDGKESQRLRFIIPTHEDNRVQNPKVLLVLQEGQAREEKEGVLNTLETIDVLATPWEKYHKSPVLYDEKVLLSKMLEDYKMSVTHLNNFLNVSGKGPQAFLEDNLLRFPQAKSPSDSYGTAVHKTIELIYRFLKKDGEMPDSQRVLSWFDSELLNQRLSEKDYTLYSGKGREALTEFYNQKKNTFKPSHFIEVNFRNQGVVVGEAALTGKIDKMALVSNTEIRVHDFKTGKAAVSWDGKSLYEKIKLHNYQRQLVFYKILVENSREFGNRYKVNSGVLEFIEPQKGKVIDLTEEITADSFSRTSALIEKVYKKILNLDFPDVSVYSKDLKGILAFENDLLEGKV